MAAQLGHKWVRTSAFRPLAQDRRPVGGFTTQNGARVTSVYPSIWETVSSPDEGGNE